MKTDSLKLNAKWFSPDEPLMNMKSEKPSDLNKKTDSPVMAWNVLDGIREKVQKVTKKVKTEITDIWY